MSRVNDLINTYYSPEMYAQRKRARRSFICAIIFALLSMGCLLLIFLTLVTMLISQRWEILLLLLVLVLLVCGLIIAGFTCSIRGVILSRKSHSQVEQQMVATHVQSAVREKRA